MLLDKVTRIEVDPFPHVIVENALEEGFYQDLVRTRPTPKQIIGPRETHQNQRIDMPTQVALRSAQPIWVEFCKAHTSRKFWDRVFELFGDEIRRLYPRSWNVSVGLRGEGKDAGLECQIGLNTPTENLSKVRGPHLDNPKELYAGLFYMASDEDGGDLELYRWKERRFHGKLEVPDECVERVKTVLYKANTFVFFINSDCSLHGVTPRRSQNYRNLVNVIADMREPLFKVGHGNY
jgi:hypothetical protein